MSETSEKIATLASKVLKDSSSTDIEKELAGCALSQTNTDKETSERISSLAGKVLHDSNSTSTGRELAGSCLEQYK